MNNLEVDCEHCKKRLVIKDDGNYNIDVRPFKAHAFFLFIKNREKDEVRIHLHNGEIWTTDNQAAAKDWADTVGTEWPGHTVEIVEFDGLEGESLSECKKKMLADWRDITDAHKRN
jgi:hypothetical protein